MEIDKYYPLDSPIHSFLIQDGFSVKYRNGNAIISYGSRSISVTRRNGDLYNLDRRLYFNSRTALLAYAQRLKEF